jgi:hypothetical protein
MSHRRATDATIDPALALDLDLLSADQDQEQDQDQDIGEAPRVCCVRRRVI